MKKSWRQVTNWIKPNGDFTCILQSSQGVPRIPGPRMYESQDPRILESQDPRILESQDTGSQDA